jgi:hypothetical protein
MITDALEGPSERTFDALSQYGRPLPCTLEVTLRYVLQSGTCGLKLQVLYPLLAVMSHVSPLKLEIDPLGASTVTLQADEPALNVCDPPGQRCRVALT